MPFEAFRLLPGSAQCATYGSSPRFERHFCGICGSSVLFRRRGSAATHVELCHGSLDSPEEWRPRNHIWTSVKLPHVALCDDLPGWATEPGMQEPGLQPTEDTSDIRGRTLEE